MRVSTHDQLMELLDGLYSRGADRTSRDAAGFWDALFQDQGHPLNSDFPDASLVAWNCAGLLVRQPHGTALDIGCGLGRNSRWLAARGFTVTGIDIAPWAIEEAARRSREHSVTAIQRDFIREGTPGAPFDLVYDSGCFHHLPPHRRISYMDSLDASLAPGGLFGICTFAAGRMGTAAADDELLCHGRLHGGIGYTLDELQEMFCWLDIVDAGPMPAAEAVGESTFSQDFLNVALFHKKVNGQSNE